MIACPKSEPVSELDAYDYPLPEDLIAQEPLADRAAARLLLLNRHDGSISHHRVRDLPQILGPEDLMVVNDTQVVPARLVGRREATGGRWEGLFLATEEVGGRTLWRLVARTRGRPGPGERIVLVDASGRDSASLELVERGEGGTWLVAASPDEPATTLLARVGRVPLPGYIRGGEAMAADTDRYQTVFSRHPGSAAAPTAGLHFTDELLAAIAARGIARANVTLHVGLDTFRPITAERLDEHRMHTEWCECPQATVDAIHRTRSRGGRVVAVGTTTMRTLETAAARSTGAQGLSAWNGPTDLFIRPGFSFKAVDGLLTNFHLPRTTLMVLVSTFASRESILRAYDEAIRERYRLLSYGDCMLII